MSATIDATLRGVEAVHQRHVAGRRAQRLSQHLAKLIPADARVLDVGCGDGEIAWTVSKLRPDLDIRGVDVLVRPETHIPIDPYDGATLPYEDDAYDVVTLVDVLHHCEDPVAVLREAARVARRGIVVKDHLRQGIAGRQTLRFMDWVGNHRYGVALPYNYLSPQQWEDAFEQLGLKVTKWQGKLGLYPWPAGLLFDRSLHFVARLTAMSASTPDLPPTR